MEFVFVSTPVDLLHSNRVISESIAKITDSYLFSLVPAVNKKNSGMLTVSNVGHKIIDSKMDIFKNHKLMIDSGGYSILSNSVPAEKIDVVRQCYMHYIQNAADDFDFVFSLDIPCIPKEPGFNQAAIIHEENRKALESTIEACRAHPELKEKLFFVWHFKMRPQYYIWKDLHDSLDIPRYFQNYAVGGMVGLRKATGIRFSGFTGMCYGCLRDFLKGNFPDRRFRMHILGIYLPCDRFQILLLEKIFRTYIQDHEQEAVFSYDSVNPKKSALNNNTKTPFVDLTEEGLSTAYKTLSEVPARYVEKIYTPLGYEMFTEEMKRLIDYGRKQNALSFVPVYTYSFKITDQLFEKLIDEYEIVELITKTSSSNKIENELQTILDEFIHNYPYIFTKRLCECIQTNVKRLHMWHSWFQNSSDKMSYDKMMEYEIIDIGFPNIIQ